MNKVLQFVIAALDAAAALVRLICVVTIGWPLLIVKSFCEFTHGFMEDSFDILHDLLSSADRKLSERKKKVRDQN